MALEKERLQELRIDRSGSPPRRGLKIWIGFSSALLVVLAVAALWFHRPSTAQVQVARVREISAASGAPVLNASGYVTARRQATVSSEITGRIVEVLVEEGMEVWEGQVLARLDDSLIRANLALAEAQLVSARKALEEIEVRLHEAELNLERVRRLEAEGFDSEANLDAAEAEVDSLRARLATGREEVAVAVRLVEVRQAQLDDTVIRAPFSAVAISKDAQPGEMVSPVSAGGGFTRTGICTLVDMSSLEIEVDVNEAYINRVRAGQRVEATLDAYPDWRIAARVITTVPAADRQRATVKVRIAFDELEPRVLPDMGVKVGFLDAEEGSVETVGVRTLVPRSAIRQEGEGQVLFVLVGERVERRAVSLGSALGEDVEVVSGVGGGERVVVEPPAELADGDRVKVE
jgi:RND family efflux transporter MFP subunit